MPPPLMCMLEHYACRRYWDIVMVAEVRRGGRMGSGSSYLSPGGVSVFLSRSTAWDVLRVWSFPGI